MLCGRKMLNQHVHVRLTVQMEDEELTAPL